MDPHGSEVLVMWCPTFSYLEGIWLQLRRNSQANGTFTQTLLPFTTHPLIIMMILSFFTFLGGFETPIIEEQTTYQAQQSDMIPFHTLYSCKLS
jgi:hypothetical protein